MEIKFQFFITAVSVLSRVNLIPQYLLTPCTFSILMGVSCDKLRQTKSLGNANELNDLSTPLQESLVVCKPASSVAIVRAQQVS